MALVDIVGLYNELLLDGSYRGIPFSIIDSRDEVGRRIQAFLFPGQDLVGWQDLGQWDGPITVTGIIVGDDFTWQGQRLRNAFQQPGPATLVHPLIGDMQVELAPGAAPQISFKHDELRVCTFTAVFRRWAPRRPAQPSTLQAILSAISDLRAQALAMLATVLEPVALTLAVVSAVESLAGDAAGILGNLVLTIANPTVGLAGALPIGLLSQIAGTPPDTNYATTVGTTLAAPSAAIAATSTPVVPAVVAAGGDTAAPTVVDGRVTTGLLLTAAGQMMPTASQPAPRQAVGIVLVAFVLADALTAASDITFVSQQEAEAWRDRVTAAIDAATVQAWRQVSVPRMAAPAAALWRSLAALRAAWLADLSATIGTLPAVRTFTPPAPASLWRIAQYLAGDDPSQVRGMWLDLIQRNGVIHPALPLPGPLEVLQ